MLAVLRGERARFLVHVNIQGSISAAASKLDVLLVGALGGPASASIYKIGVQFGTSPLLMSDPLFVAAYPLFTRWRAVGQGAAIRTVGRKASLVLAALAIPVALVLAVKSKAIVSMAVGSQFSGAWLPMVIILFGVLPTVLLFWGRAAMLTFGDARQATKVIGTAAGVQLVLLFSLVPPFGSTGAATALAAMNIAGALLTSAYLRRRQLL